MILYQEVRPAKIQMDIKGFNTNQLIMNLSRKMLKVKKLL